MYGKKGILMRWRVMANLWQNQPKATYYIMPITTCYIIQYAVIWLVAKQRQTDSAWWIFMNQPTICSYMDPGATMDPSGHHGLFITCLAYGKAVTKQQLPCKRLRAEFVDIANLLPSSFPLLLYIIRRTYQPLKRTNVSTSYRCENLRVIWLQTIHMYILIYVLYSVF